MLWRDAWWIICRKMTIDVHVITSLIKFSYYSSILVLHVGFGLAYEQSVVF